MKKLVLSCFLGFCVYSSSISLAATEAIKPSTGAQALSTWVIQAAQSVMTFGYEDFEKRKTENQPLFTDKGFNSFYEAMKVSGIPNVVLEDKLHVSAVSSCPPEIKNAGGGRWEVTVPLVIDYKAESSSKKQNQLATIIVSQKQEGIFGIDQWVARPLSEAQAQVCGSNEQKKARIGELRREIAQRQAELKALESKIH